MSKKDEILREGIKKNGLEKQIPIGSFMWEFITDCMQVHTDQEELEQWNVTIEQIRPAGSAKLSKESETCKHVWLLMGYACWVCDKCNQFEKR
jgi:hypothetical protein